MAPSHEHVASSSSSSSGSEAAVVTVDVSTAASDLLLTTSDGQQLYRYLDVRTEEEMGKGHLENSLNVAYMFITPQGREKNPLFVDQVASLLSKHQNILVLRLKELNPCRALRENTQGCQSGKRSELACIDLLAAGFNKVKNVGGGYAAWVGNGFPVVHTPPNQQP